MPLGFSLSPAVTVREVNATGSVPNLPSAKTGMVLRADQGPALDVVEITNENDLISTFGKPNAYNYQDWFQCWNFLQYASSLYVVRPIDANTTTKNAGISLVGDDSVTYVEQVNMFNERVAENTLENFDSGLASSLTFFNREVTSEQKLAVAVVSSPQYFKSPIGLEFSAAATNISGMSVTAAPGNTLTKGSQAILSSGKLVVVNSVTQSTSASSVITLDTSITDADVAPFYAVASSAQAGATCTFFKDKFSFRVGTKLINNGNVYVTKIENILGNNLEYLVTFSGTATPAISANNVVTSNTINYSGTTAYNNNTVQFGVAVGDMSINMNAGFVLDPGTTFTLNGQPQVFSVASIDESLNKINLTFPVTADIASVSGIPLVITSSSVFPSNIIGINYYDKKYDSGLITKTKRYVTNAAGDSIQVYAQSLVSFNKIFDYPPNYVNNEFGLVVLRKNDLGLYEKVEDFIASYAEGARDINGNIIFVDDLLFKTSKYIYGKVGDLNAARVNTANARIPQITYADKSTTMTIYPQKQSNGSGYNGYDKYDYSGYNYTQGDIMQAYALFSDPEMFDINILTCHPLDTNYASTISETRRDCVAVVAPYDYQILATSSANDCTQYLLDNFGSQTVYEDKLFDAFGTYSAVYGNMKYQYDKFNNVNRWINIAGDVAGLYAQTDNTNDPWWAPAGTSRGVIKNCIKLAFNPNKQNRDELYVNSINPVMAIAGEGSAIVWGQKTATATPSAFDRVNVRRLLIYLEKTISTACKIGLFEFNDTFTRTRLYNVIDPFLRTVQSRRGLYAYKLVIDESNNTNQVIDSNGLVVDIYLQPTKVAEFIRLSAIVVPTGANFSEYVGSF